MIEDALKSTRNLHGLILVVSLVTLIFSLSLKVEETKRTQKLEVDALLRTDFLAYETWLSAKLQPAIDENLGPAARASKRRLKTSAWSSNSTKSSESSANRPTSVSYSLMKLSYRTLQSPRSRNSTN